MAVLKPIEFKTRDGRHVVIRSPEVSEGEQMLNCMGGIIDGPDTRNFLITGDEFKKKYTIKDEEEMIGRYRDNPKSFIASPFVDGKMAGLMTFATKERTRVNYIGEFGLSLRRDCQGVGIGSQLIKALLEWAKATPGIEKVMLRAHAANKDAIKLYERFGFIHEGLEPKGVKFEDGTYDDVVQMYQFVK